MSNFIPPGDPLLKKRAFEVSQEEVGSEKIEALIERMLEVAGGNRTDSTKRGLVGLAAPQIGERKRIILVDIGIDDSRKGWGDLKVYINPEILWRSDEWVDGREGCFSVDSHVTGIVPRAERIEIRALDREGTEIFEKLSGFTARIFQHEVDHLDGIRFPERVGEEGILHWVEESQYPEYREKWQTWPVRCPWSTWVAMRDGDPYTAP